MFSCFFLLVNSLTYCHEGAKIVFIKYECKSLYKFKGDCKMNSSGKKLIAGLSAFSLILTSTVAQAMAETTATSALKGTRLYGKNRYETAAQISKAGWNSSDYVVLASGESFADALCAAPLAKKLNAPILLTEKNALDPAAKAELKRLNAKHVVIVGLYGAVSKSAEDSAKAITGDVRRIGGADRYETSALIAKELGKSTEVAIASGEDYPDALSIASVAASEKMPILLTKKDALSGKTADYINANKANITKTYIIGGVGAVSEAAAKAAGTNEVRLGGKDRFETNAEVLENFEDELNFKNVYAAVGNGANGSGFADAISGAALASKTSSPIVLVYKDITGKTVDMLTKELAPKKNVVALGGAAVVPDSIIAKINSIKIPAVVFSVDGETKGSADVKSDNVEVDAKNVTLKDANVSGNVYIYGDGAKLSNVKVAGTVYVDPGENGSVTLENVHASNIRVRSGAQNSIHLINVQSDKMIVESDNPTNSVRIESTGTTSITNTIVSCYAILDSNGGTLGTITITENGPSGKVVELEGKFTEPVVVDGTATLNVAAGAAVAALDVKCDATITLASGATVAALTVDQNAAGTKLDVAKDADVTSMTGDGSKTVTVTGDGKDNVNKGGNIIPGGGASNYQPTAIEEKVNAYITLFKDYQYGSRKVSDYVTFSSMTYRTMTVTLNKNYKDKTAEDLFNKVEGVADLGSKLDSVEGKLKTFGSTSNITIAGQTIVGYLHSKVPTYVNADGTLNKTKILADFYANDTSYDTLVDFAKDKLKDKISQYDLDTYMPALTLYGENITKVTKGGVTLFDSADKKVDNLNSIRTFVNNNNINRDSTLSAIVGTYTVTIGSVDYTIIVNVGN